MEIKREYHTIDVAGKSVGRVATRIAQLLQGKHKPTYVPNVDAGDFVEIANVDQLSVTQKKAVQKVYQHHTMHPGGLKSVTLKHVMKTNPEKVVEEAVSHMLPKNKLRSGRMKRLTFKK